MGNNENSVYFSGDHYDQRTGAFQEDLPFWMAQAEKYGGPLLELACGTGRVAIPLAGKGYSLVGIDVAQSMLNEGKKKADPSLKIEWLLGDIRDFDLRREFPLIIFPFNALCHIETWQDFASLLKCIGKHLKEEGRFIIDVFNPSLEVLNRSEDLWYPHSVYSHPEGDKTIKGEERNRYNRATQINSIEIAFNSPGEPETRETLTMRIYYPQELDALLYYSGFEVVEKYGDYDLSPFESSSPKQLVICRRRP